MPETTPPLDGAPAFLDASSRPPLRTGPGWSLFGVWYRHVAVYCLTLFANAAPPVLEPLFFFLAAGFGLRQYMTDQMFDGLSYTTFVASGLLTTSAMFTGVFETTFATFVRLRWQKTYDAMLSTHLLPNEVFIGELLFCATKGGAFATVVMLVTLLFGVSITPWCVLVPLLGFWTAFCFGAIGLIVTSYIKMMNNFAFFTTGVITPLFFFSGTFFPVRGLHPAVDVIWFLSPLTHAVELTRDLYTAEFALLSLAHVGMLAAYTAIAVTIALRRMRGRVLG